MNDRQRQRLVEQCEEAELTLLMYDYAREEGRQLAKEYDEAQKNGTLPEIPEELDRKCRALIDVTFAKMERKTRLKRIVRSAAKAAAVLFVVLGMMATTVMSVDALRVPVINFRMDQSEKFGIIFFDGNANIESKDDNVVARFEGNIPAGYVGVQKDVSESSILICYANSEGELISFDAIYSENGIVVDTENSQINPFEKNGIQGYFFSKEGYRAIWADSSESIIYTLYASSLTEKEFLTMLDALIQ